MKKSLLLAIFTLLIGACYTPMNNSGVSTNKPWLEVSGTRLDFRGDQYDSCFQFNIRLWPQEAVERINLSKSCITACCWRSEQNEVVLDFNKDFEQELALKGRARKYSPDKITLKVTHSNFVNLTKVTISPHGAINNKGLLKLSYEEVENPARLAQLHLAQQNRKSVSTEQVYTAPTTVSKTTRQKKVVSKTTISQSAAPVKTVSSPEADKAKELLHLSKGTQIDTYFYQMNKIYSKQGAVFLLSDRLLQAAFYDKNTYLISCHAKARTGVDETNLKAADFPCGKWLVNIIEETITPYDKKAKNIAQL